DEVGDGQAGYSRYSRSGRQAVARTGRLLVVGSRAGTQLSSGLGAVLLTNDDCVGGAYLGRAATPITGFLVGVSLTLYGSRSLLRLAERHPEASLRHYFPMAFCIAASMHARSSRILFASSVLSLCGSPVSIIVDSSRSHYAPHLAVRSIS